MRRALILSLACLSVTCGVAFAQQSRNADGSSIHNTRPGNSGPSSSSSSGGERQPRFQIPISRCPDLGLGAYAYVTAIPGADPLGADEVALQWSISNGGTAPYMAGNAGSQSLVLEYSSAGGVQQVGATPIPQQTDATGGVSLGQGQSWRGYLRVNLPPEARRRNLRLRIAYAGDGRTLANDCDIANNEVAITRPPAAPAPATP